MAPVKSRLAILILAAGKSTRVAKVINGRQKCGEVVRVPFIGAEVPAIQYQIEFANIIADIVYNAGYETDIFVVVGYRSKDVIRWLVNYSKPVTIIYDTEIEGIANVWRRFVDKYCCRSRFSDLVFCKYDVLVSINGDDIHDISVARDIGNLIALFTDREGEMSVDGIVVTTEKTAVKGKSVYLADEKNLVRKVREKAYMVADEGKLNIGTGIYVLKMKRLARVKYKRNKSTGEYEPGDVLNRIIAGGGKIYMYTHPIEKWIDIGNPYSLRMYLVGDT